MKYAKWVLSMAALAGLAACSTPVTNPAVAEGFDANITRFSHSDVNEAASAYVALYKHTIEKTVAQRQYQEDLAYKHLTAEACFDSRANRLLNKPVSHQEKEELILSYVSREELKQYQTLSKGYFNRINALELLTCDTAGLKVASNAIHN
ncbi:hypothetical protein [Hydrogenophaga taeniospiralis]|nr:hypothetical protein [Hydrogenophaga taeniospiralis]